MDFNEVIVAFQDTDVLEGVPSGLDKRLPQHEFPGYYPSYGFASEGG